MIRLVLAAAVALLLLPATALEGRPMPEETAESLSYERFVTDYVQKRTPVVIRGFMRQIFDEKMGKGANVRDYIRKVCGHRSLLLSDDGSHGVRQLDPALRGVEWGALAESNLTDHGLETVADLLDYQAEMLKNPDEPVENLLYLHDTSIDQLCPELLDVFRIPKYFPHDFMFWSELGAINNRPRQHLFPAKEGEDVVPFHFLPEEDGRTHQWPSLFLGPNRTQSSVHVDSMATHFWMTVVEGTKQWKIFSIEQAVNLYPQREAPLLEDLMDYGHFKVDVFEPDHRRYPKLKNAWSWDAMVHGGDVVYVPPLAPHAVKNIGDTVAYSYNQVDRHNLHLNLAMRQEDGESLDTNTWLFKFLADEHTKLPLPTAEAETLGQYYARNHPISVMYDSNNIENWNQRMPGMPFEMWFSEEWLVEILEAEQEQREFREGEEHDEDDEEGDEGDEGYEGYDEAGEMPGAADAVRDEL
eukprot:m.308496 g.308496  ORF g.308496 m.308496 type:complete len:470 (-) comp21379_c0_seq1:253-1662(-)